MHARNRNLNALVNRFLYSLADDIIGLLRDDAWHTPLIANQKAL